MTMETRKSNMCKTLRAVNFPSHIDLLYFFAVVQKIFCKRKNDAKVENNKIKKSDDTVDK